LTFGVVTLGKPSRQLFLLFSRPHNVNGIKANATSR
jgi:hypothetical protein